jgi:hypothetical protein
VRTKLVATFCSSFHADSMLLRGALNRINEVLSANTEIIGRNFRLVFDGDIPFSRWLTRSYAWIRAIGLYYGDSGILSVVQPTRLLGGFRPIGGGTPTGASPICCASWCGGRGHWAERGSRDPAAADTGRTRRHDLTAVRISRILQRFRRATSSRWRAIDSLCSMSASCQPLPMRQKVRGYAGST